MNPLELQASPSREKIMSVASSAVLALSPRKFSTRRSSLPAPSHTSTVQAGTHNGAANLPQTKKLNKCSIDKLCLMTASPIGRQRAERNRTKLYARIKHSMLIFTSISVNKNNSFYNSEGQKKCSIRTNINRTKVYVNLFTFFLFSEKRF